MYTIRMYVNKKKWHQLMIKLTNWMTVACFVYAKEAPTHKSNARKSFTLYGALSILSCLWVNSGT